MQDCFKIPFSIPGDDIDTLFSSRHRLYNEFTDDDTYPELCHDSFLLPAQGAHTPLIAKEEKI